MTGRKTMDRAAAAAWDRAAMAACLGAGLALLPAGTLRADGLFFKTDVSENSVDTVGVMARGPLTFGVNYSDYVGGHSVSLTATYAFPLGDVATLRVGPSLGRAFGDGAEEDWRLGAKLAVDRYQTTGFGYVYLLGEYNTIDNDWYVGAQAGVPSGWGIEVSAGGSDAYDARTVALTRRIGEGPVTLRAGYKLLAEEAFIGVSINTF